MLTCHNNFAKEHNVNIITLRRNMFYLEVFLGDEDVLEEAQCNPDPLRSAPCNPPYQHFFFEWSEQYVPEQNCRRSCVGILRNRILYNTFAKELPEVVKYNQLPYLITLRRSTHLKYSCPRRQGRSTNRLYRVYRGARYRGRAGRAPCSLTQCSAPP